MKILILCIHYPVASGRYIARAFKRLGHEVRTGGPEVGNKIWGIDVDPRHNWPPDFDPARDDWQPDLVITADSGYYLDWRPIPETPFVLWGVDNHTRTYHELNQQFDALFLAHSWAARMGEPNTHWLPPGYDPQAHTDLGLERDYDVAMIGIPYPERIQIMQTMQEAGLKVIGKLGALGDDYNALYNRAKIALVKSLCGDLPMRFLENMAQGCCILADPIPDADNLGFLAGTDYWPYETADDAVTAAKSLIVSGAWRNIAAQGKAKVTPHTWDARALEFLRRVEQKQYAPDLELAL